MLNCLLFQIAWLFFFQLFPAFTRFLYLPITHFHFCYIFLLLFRRRTLYAPNISICLSETFSLLLRMPPLLMIMMKMEWVSGMPGWSKWNNFGRRSTSSSNIFSSPLQSSPYVLLPLPFSSLYHFHSRFHTFPGFDGWCVLPGKMSSIILLNTSAPHTSVTNKYSLWTGFHPAFATVYGVITYLK